MFPWCLFTQTNWCLIGEYFLISGLVMTWYSSNSDEFYYDENVSVVRRDVIYTESVTMSSLLLLL